MQPLFPKLPPPDNLFWERKLWKDGHAKVAGLDEVGRGALAGPVVAAAVILKPHSEIPGVDDSKKFDSAQRDILYDLVIKEAYCYSIVAVSNDRIDLTDILRASLEAMCLCIEKLTHSPDYLLIDGNQGLRVNIPQRTIIKGDSLSQSIGAASIIAKVTRDRLMAEMEREYGQFRFSVHKGYGTGTHMDELKTHGPTPIHRKSFAPVLKSMEISAQGAKDGLPLQWSSHSGRL